MISSYSFVLNFEELDSELLEEKIDAYIEKSFENGECENFTSVEEAIEDGGLREQAERDIARHFPIYF